MMRVVQDLRRLLTRRRLARELAMSRAHLASAAEHAAAVRRIIDQARTER
jgi:hypothetical protein